MNYLSFLLDGLRSAGSLIAVVAIAATASPAWCADPAKPVATDAAAVRLLVTLVRSPHVQADLKLDERQTAQINAAVEEIDQPLWRIRELPAEKSSDAVKSLGSKFQDKLALALNPKQRQRVEQLVLRAKGLAVFKDKDFADRLTLTATQQKQIAAVFAGGEAKPEPAKLAAAEKKVMSILTDHQRSSLDAILGKPLDFSRVPSIGVKAPEIVGIDGWINSQPVKLSDLRGKVVVLHFWTFGCINCQRNLPIYKTWYDELPRDRVAMVGIHTPETKVEHQFAELQRSVKQRDLKFPVAMDIRGDTWNAWGNSIWPAVYLIDRHGDVRYWWYGELKWNGAEGDKLMRQRIEQLIEEKD